MVNDTDAAKIASMTGYAAREGGAEGLAWTWELRSVNGRGLDIRLRLPDGLGALEAPLRQALKARLARGTVSLSLRMTRQTGAEADALPNDGIAIAIARLKQIRSAADDHFITLHPATAAEVYALMPGTEVARGTDLPSVDALMADAAPLIDAFCDMRTKEGLALEQVLIDQLTRVTALIDAAAEAAGHRAEGQATRLRTNLQALLQQQDDLDEARLAQELALIAAKSDVTEEIDRLRTHVDAAVALLERGGAVGRKLDFLMQEFNREANTLCSKSGDAALTAIGLDLKLVIDQMREQVQNLE
ncbi:MAG: YicC/YloC family endoribonuclease [Pseudomonadota bacterium]